ncbi:hypothetical protein COOONC_27490, partial [Cooperia oncophora]
MQHRTRRNAEMTESGHCMRTKGKNTTGETNSKGVAIAVSDEMRIRISEIRRKSDRLISAIDDVAACRLHVLSVYAPQKCVAEVPENELLSLCGDLNGRVGSTQGGYNCHGNNEYGILDFAETNDLAICNTFFKKRHSHLVAHASCTQESQIDFILVRRRDLPRISNKKVIPSEAIRKSAGLEDRIKLNGGDYGKLIRRLRLP